MTALRSTRWRRIVTFLSVVAFAGLFHEQIIGRVTYAVEKGKLEAGQEHLASIESLSGAFRMVAKQVKPAVVRIYSTTQAEPKVKREKGGRERIDPKDMPEPWKEFFEEFGGREFRTPDPQPREGSGSGVIIDAEAGYVLTNNHVVGDAGTKQTRLDVHLADGRRVKASVIGRDPKTDLALIQIKADRLHALPLGDSEQLEVGDWVLAVGAPFGLEQTVTQGIISAKGRSHVGIVGYEDFLQTDAAINPGNSGGPLVNLHGEVIGINTAIATNGLVAGYMGIGFAIPTKMIKEILPNLKEGKEIVRGYLGVQIRNLEDEPGLGKTFGLKDDVGVLIEDVLPKTPAAKAGLKAEDVVLQFNGKKLASAAELQEMVARTKPDTKVSMQVWRENKEITIPVVIEKQPENFFVAGGKSRGDSKRGGDEEAEVESGTVEALGVTVEPLTKALAKQYGWEENEEKNVLIVTDVESLGEGRALGIQAGDLILSVQGDPVDSIQDLKSALSSEALKKGVRIRVKTKAGPRSLFLQINP